MEKINLRRRIILLFLIIMLFLVSVLPILEILFKKNLTPYFFEVVNQNISYFGLQFNKGYLFDFFIISILISTYFIGNIGYLIFKIIKGVRLIKKDQNTHRDFVRNQTW